MKVDGISCIKTRKIVRYWELIYPKREFQGGGRRY